MLMTTQAWKWEDGIKISCVKGTDFSSLLSGQVEPGDVIYFRGVVGKVMAVVSDAFFPEGCRDI